MHVWDFAQCQVIGARQTLVCGKAWKGQGAVWLGTGPGGNAGRQARASWAELAVPCLGV